MKRKLFFFGLSLLSSSAWAASPQPPVVLAPSPVITRPPPPVTVYNYEQKPLAGRQPLVTAEQAQGIIDKFKAAYPRFGSPRFIVYVNPKLADLNAGAQLTAQSNTPPASGAPGTAPKETLSAHPEPKEPPLADRQTMRDVERLFGRPLRFADASLTDQRLATQAMANKNITSLRTQDEQTREVRETLSKIADVAIEVLISAKSVIVPELSGDRTYALPDIQATAIQLKDSKILGQAASSDAVKGNPAYYARNFDVREITETTALALMEDMLANVPGAPQAATKP